MENDKISINSLELLDTISKNDAPKTIVLRKSNNLDIAYGVNLDRLDKFFISVSALKKLEKQLTEFKDDIDRTVREFVMSETINSNKYLLKTEADRKKSELITYDKLDEILRDYIKEDELEQSIYECEEHAYACANAMYTSIVTPAAVVRSTNTSIKVNERIASSIADSDNSDDNE